MTKRFNGKVALVTGASSGLGKSVALLLASEGASVIGTGRNEERLQAVAEEAKANGGEMSVFIADQSEPQQCEAAIEAAVSRYGKLDVLINNAGVHDMHHTLELTVEQWQADIANNLSGPFYLSRYALPHLLESNGNIVNVGSLASQQGQPYSAGYCSAKHGLIGLTRAMAIEYTQQSIRVNAVCPGGMMTAQIERFSPPEGADFDLILRSSAPRGMMEADQVAQTIAFVASDQASAIHGAVIMADNGKTVG